MPTLYTIGHSTRTIQEFVEIMKTYDINCVVDIRSIPKSRHVPWFNEDSLKRVLKKNKISYVHLPLLGGLRHAMKNRNPNENRGWRNNSFRNYADYMQTPDFFHGLKQLNNIIRHFGSTVIMCAEAVPWRCHRSLVADAEIVRNVHVIDIFSPTSARLHKLTSFAKVDRKRRPIKITYP